MLMCVLLLAPTAKAGTDAETTPPPSKKEVPRPRTHSIDTSRMNEADLRKWDQVVELAGQKDTSGHYANATLHDTLERLDSDRRTFVIANESLGTGTVGKFIITKFSGPDDFSEAAIALDFEGIRKIHSTTPGDFDAGFHKYEGLFGKDGFLLRLAETFGHEASHAIFAIENPRQATELQRRMDERDAAFAALPVKHRYPLPASLVLEMEATNDAIIPTERFAQEAERSIHDELSTRTARIEREARASKRKDDGRWAAASTPAADGGGR
jgi:hypothetical protein